MGGREAREGPLRRAGGSGVEPPRLGAMHDGEQRGQRGLEAPAVASHHAGAEGHDGEGQAGLQPPQQGVQLLVVHHRIAALQE